MHFVKGDIVVCVSLDKLDERSIKELKLYGQYTVKEVIEITDFVILTFKELECAYDIYRFKTLEQFRKDKIDKIKDRINETNISNGR